ncbi:hypothetical protein [uncultured Lacinutrix sp.]|uniref:hypothetical protein n=1 Tax=uncultured Lacinutrix sp. TaxID=574032 RepID=UPI00261CDF8F|nr:hypothetical protein [uncultured Lacinutrix sp.]
MKKALILLTLFLFSKINSQTLENNNTIITIDIVTTHNDSNYAIPYAISKISSDTKNIGTLLSDYDGLSRLNICSKKILNNKIKLQVFGIDCKPFEREYKIIKDTTINIKLKCRETNLKSRKDIDSFIYKNGIRKVCGTINLIDEEIENANYIHCDGRIKKYNNIPANEIHEWDKI